ncbi:MAG TPA: methyltransferase, TIGR04325 family [Steroidobacteraceae bacterium]|nr:methyltransferase, TIGR04325 family [Steroidobacteraceae bacterium]
MRLKLLKPLVPPLLADLVSRARSPIRFSGEFASWEAAAARAGGYDAREITDRVLAATRKVAAGEAAYERDTVLFDRIEYAWPVLASLLQVGLERGALRVVDFGGSLGSTWRQNSRYLQRLRIPLSWHVVEQEHLVALGNQEFSGDVLRFYPSITEAARGGADVVLFSSSLCYVRDAEQCVREAAAAPFIVVDRLPIISGARDRIAVQHVSEPIYRASYPIRLFAEETLMSGLLAGWCVRETWDCDLQPDRDSRCRGFFLEKR